MGTDASVPCIDEKIADQIVQHVAISRIIADSNLEATSQSEVEMTRGSPGVLPLRYDSPVVSERLELIRTFGP